MATPSVPCVLVASSTEYDPRELVKEMLGNSALPSATHVLEQIEAYPWHIDTKYYTADIQICTTATRTIGNEEFAENVQGFVLHFNPSEDDGLQKVGFWLPYIKEIDPAVQILVCERCLHNGVISKLDAQKWCLENGFELVELHPEEDGSDSEEDDFQETTGVKRIVQALHAHTWPNLVMKDNPTFRSPYMTQMMVDSAREQMSLQQLETSREHTSEETNSADAASNPSNQHSNDSCPNSISSTSAVPNNSESNPTVSTNNVPQETLADSASAADREESLEGATASSRSSTNVPKSKAEKDKKNQQKKSGVDIIDSMVPDSDLALYAALGNDDPTEESFEQLFEKMRLMKERAENLPPEQRKLYAEQIAIQFWRAIGGDEDEIDGLSSGDDDDGDDE